MTSSAAKTEIERGGIVPDAVVLELYRKMLTVSYVEERLKVFDQLGKVSFHASAHGHEKLQIRMTLLLKPPRLVFYLLPGERYRYRTWNALERYLPGDAEPGP